MKRILTLILATVVVNVVSAQGIKKQSKQQPPKQALEQPASQDSVVIKGSYRNDTAKVVALLYVEDGSITWVKGYVVVKSFTPQGQGAAPLAAGQVLYNQKFELIKPEDVYDVKQLQWR